MLEGCQVNTSDAVGNLVALTELQNLMLNIFSSLSAYLIFLNYEIF